MRLFTPRGAPPGTRHGTRHLTPGTRHEALDARRPRPAPSTQHPAPSTQHPAPSDHRSLSGDTIAAGPRFVVPAGDAGDYGSFPSREGGGLWTVDGRT